MNGPQTMDVIPFHLLAVRRALAQNRSAEAAFDRQNWARFRRPLATAELAILKLVDVTDDSRWAETIEGEPMILGVYADGNDRYWQVRLLGSLRGERWVIEPLGSLEAVTMRYGEAVEF
ncbi:hypothetical protein [Azospirillum sp. sgz302134]